MGVGGACKASSNSRSGVETKKTGAVEKRYCWLSCYYSFLIIASFGGAVIKSTANAAPQEGIWKPCSHSGRGGPTIRIVVCWIVDLNVTIRIAANCRDPDCGICASPQDPTIRIVGS